MLRKLLLATTITITLHLFLGVNSTSQSNVQQPSKHNSSQTSLTTAVEIQTK